MGSGKKATGAAGTEALREQAVVLHPVFEREKASFLRPPEACLEEAVKLSLAIHLDVVHSACIPVKKQTPSLLFGKGQVENLRTIINAQDVGLVVVNHTLSPGQQRNLERAWGAKVIDRTGLILEIFGERAQTKEGQLQVELAALTYQKSRLVRSWTHLERQRGGFGFTGGPGETQIEIDRRLITERITKLKKELEQVRKTRKLARKSREKVPYPVVALVGYTNAGKSTLFNHLTGENVFAKDLLFATLDPKMRAIRLSSGIKVIVSDTVGFISNLPTQLVAAFRATLEEVEEADVILHVRDISTDYAEAEQEDVRGVLGELGIDLEQDSRVIDVLNKVDLLSKQDREYLENISARHDRQVVVSALTGEGLDMLLEKINTIVTSSHKIFDVKLAPADGKALAWLYRHGHIIKEDMTDHGLSVKVEMSPIEFERFRGGFQ